MLIKIVPLFRKLRKKEFQKILIHMCLSLIGLYVSFILSQVWERFYDEESMQWEPVCITISALVHYFLLVYFIITAAQSILLYLKLVKVMKLQYLLENYHIKAGIISWSEFCVDQSGHFACSGGPELGPIASLYALERSEH